MVITMEKQNTNFTYTFENPNTPQAFEKALGNIILNKLLSGFPDTKKRTAVSGFVVKDTSM